MRIANYPANVDALRQEWIAIVGRSADRKTQRVAGWCCWENIAEYLTRYRRYERIMMLTELFEDPGFANQLDGRITHDGPKLAAAWLAERLGVSLDIVGEQ